MKGRFIDSCILLRIQDIQYILKLILKCEIDNDNTRVHSNYYPAVKENQMVEPIKNLDGKFSVKYGMAGGQIINTISGEVIPDDEPLFLLRGRDKLAVATILEYLSQAKKDNCTDLHINGIYQALTKFEQFAQQHPERMKQPGTTRHLKLEE